MNKLITAFTIAMAAASAVAVPGKITTSNGAVHTGDIKWQPASKAYIIESKKGAKGTQIANEVKFDDVEKIEIEKPKGFDAAAEAVSRHQGAGSIGTLDKIVKEYRMLQWDKPAGRYLVEAYMDANNPQKAYDAAQDIIKSDKKAAYMGELAPAYWQTLLKLGKTQQLENCLRLAATAGDRESSGQALIMRGDVILSTEGDNVESHRKALTDGYLRVALMYADCKDARKDALMRAATSLDKLGMTARAQSMRDEARSL